MNIKITALYLSIFYGLFYYERNCILMCFDKHYIRSRRRGFIDFLEERAPLALENLCVQTASRLVFKDFTTLGTSATEPSVRLKFVPTKNKSNILTGTKAEEAIIFYDFCAINHFSKEELKEIKRTFIPVLPKESWKLFRGANELEW